MSDNAAGIGTAFRHLALHGHHRIAYIGDQERVFTGRERAAAFRACVAASGGVLDGMSTRGWWSRSASRRHSRASSVIRSRRRPSSPETPAPSMQVLRYLGRRAADIALVGFDDFLLADVIRPALTVVAQDSVTIGRTAIELLLARTKDPARPLESVTVPVQLIPRGSGELPPPAQR